MEKVESEKDKKEITKRIDGYTKSMNDLEQQLITDGIINRDKVNVGQNNAEQLQAIHGMGRGATILFSMLRGEYFPKSNPNIRWQFEMIHSQQIKLRILLNINIIKKYYQLLQHMQIMQKFIKINSRANSYTRNARDI